MSFSHVLAIMDKGDGTASIAVTVQQHQEHNNTLQTDQNQRTIAIIGASADRSKYGNKAVRAFVKQGYTVYPINPRQAEVEGLKAYASVSEVPGGVEQASFYVPPLVGLTLIDDVARAGIKRIWLNPGSESDELVSRAGELGLETIVACSIVGVGMEPDDL